MDLFSHIHLHLRLSFYTVAIKFKCVSAHLHIMDHPIKKGPEKGRYQCSHGDKRYLLEGKVKTGTRGGHFQGSGDDKRYLLKVKKVK